MSYFIKKIDKSMMMMAIIHILLGIIVSGRKEIGTIWGYGSFLYGLFNIVKYGNRNDEASIFASYMVGIEVLLRSVGASVLWEFGKYSVGEFHRGISENDAVIRERHHEQVEQ